MINRHTPGREIQIRYSTSCDDSELPKLICDSEEALRTKLKESVNLEEQIADKLFSAAPAEWADQAKTTLQLQRALEYVRVKPVQHTENSWVVRDKNYWQISNMVYRMICSIYEHTSYDRARKEPLPDCWHVSWSVSLNTPNKSGDSYYNGKTIDRQDKKRYTDKAAAEKYLQGRVAAYAHLFTELSPPVPSEYERYFSLYGQPLPGYTIQPSEEAVLNELMQFVSDDDFQNDSPPATPPSTKIAPMKPKTPIRRNHESR